MVYFDSHLEWSYPLTPRPFEPVRKRAFSSSATPLHTFLSKENHPTSTLSSCPTLPWWLTAVWDSFNRYDHKPFTYKHSHLSQPLVTLWLIHNYTPTDHRALEKPSSCSPVHGAEWILSRGYIQSVQKLHGCNQSGMCAPLHTTRHGASTSTVPLHPFLASSSVPLHPSCDYIHHDITSIQRLRPKSCRYIYRASFV